MALPSRRRSGRIKIFCFYDLWDQFLHTRQPLPETPGGPLLFTISVLGSFMCITQTHSTNGFTSHPKEDERMAKCLASGHKCHDQDLNPHPAYQKHQSLSTVCLTAGPRHGMQTASVPAMAARHRPMHKWLGL